MTDYSELLEAVEDSLSSVDGNLSSRRNQVITKLLKTIDEDRQSLLGYGAQRNKHQREQQLLALALAKGMKPSEYAQEHLTWIRDKGFVAEETWLHLLDAMDRMITQPYSVGWDKRSYRSIKYVTYAVRIEDLLKDFVCDVLQPYALPDLLTGNVPKPVIEYMGETFLAPTTALIARIAYALDHNDAAVELAIRNMIDGDAKPCFMEQVIKGVIWSHRADMHELIGRLLVAARLQEGLRQVICENADMGTQEAFRTLIDVIEKNDLIRFSSVKRAVGTWLGLISEESSNLERISNKSITLISRCLRDKDFVEECLVSEDSMQLYIALWSLGVEDVQIAANRAWELANTGTHHQRLTAGIFARSLKAEKYAAELTKHVLLAYSDELDTVAVYLPMLMSRCVTDLSSDVLQRYGSDAWKAYFSDAQQARQFYDLFIDIRGRLSKKMVFDPCVFPGNKEMLEKSALAERICVTARLLNDDELIDASIAYFPECNPWNRHFLLEPCYAGMRTPKQRQMMLSSVCDKADLTRTVAIDLLDKTLLTTDDYIELEKLLRYKYADARQAIIRWLMKQPDDALYETISRLINDRKSEERRMASLDMVKQLLDADNRLALISRCALLVQAYENPTSKEQTLLDSLLTRLGAATKADEDTLYTEEDAYHPILEDTKELQGALATFLQYFPDSRIIDAMGGGKLGWLKQLFTGKSDTFKQAQDDLASLDECYEQHKLTLVHEDTGNDVLLCNLRGITRMVDEDGKNFTVHLYEVWDAWYQQHVNDPKRLLRACILAREKIAFWQKEAEVAFGVDYGKTPKYRVKDQRIYHIPSILKELVKRHVPTEDLEQMACAVLCYIARTIDGEKLWTEQNISGSLAYTYYHTTHVTEQKQFSLLLAYVNYDNSALFPTLFAAGTHLLRKSEKEYSAHQQRQRQNGTWEKAQSFASAISYARQRAFLPTLPVALRASHQGVMSQRALYEWILSSELAVEHVGKLGTLAGAFHSTGQRYSSRVFIYHMGERETSECLRKYIGKEKPETSEDLAMLQYADEVLTPLLRRVIDEELKRGDTATPYSHLVSGVFRIWGAEDFTAILSALGKDKLVRSSYYVMYGNADDRTQSLCRLLTVCVPKPTDTAGDLRKLVEQRKISEKRLIEAALYCPEWVELVEEVIGLPGFRSAAYYFMAHMNEDFDDVRKARIARFTPLSIDELKNGAFDITWFRSAFTEVGEKYFNLIYDAAKYITSGAKHSRARKYADAVLGRMQLDATKEEIIAKRNKDLLMAYALIPLSGEEDLQARYLYIQQFLKESRTYGAQRAASEKMASEIALTNLALNAGYADSMRLTLRMETRLVEENHELFEPHVIEDLTVRITVDEQGVADVLCEKAGKALKSIPAKYKKNEYILRLNDMKKQLVEQQRRAKRMLEEAMEACTIFTAGEIAALMSNPVIAPILSKLVFKHDDAFGFVSGLTLVDAAGAATALNDTDELVVAHPFHLWKAQQWLAYQQKLYADRIVQPFRQVFRELYVKTPDELGRDTSLRYAGNQLQPARTMACLKTRRWIADAEAGLQKVYYKEHIVATIWALADWFSPADIEAPTLEWVAFFDTKTGKQMKIDDVPDIIFSEVMRDVDLAVSVAHAGGVDPETSNSTVEMRAALLSFTLPLFRLNNVEIKDRHAIITGELAQYSVHLGSGVVHQIGGTMLSVLPVHSQHRGKLFLPFVDEDPKTAEIISKVLLFAEDGKLKDPTILEQIRRN